MFFFFCWHGVDQDGREIFCFCMYVCVYVCMVLARAWLQDESPVSMVRMLVGILGVPERLLKASGERSEHIQAIPSSLQAAPKTMLASQPYVS